jgi:hypothetical protein
MKRTFVVKHQFRATIVGKKDDTRIFHPGETVFCDADQVSDPVTFESDLVPFETALVEFAKNVEAPVPANPDT